MTRNSMGWMVWLVCAGCDILEPAPQDTGPKYVTAGGHSAGGDSTGSASRGTSRGAPTSTEPINVSWLRSSSGSVSRGPACPEWCSTARGYHCYNGECVLNGADGPLQVTLNWTNSPRAREDLDLHLVDPSGCEIYYGWRQCGAGSLDLDQNAACGNTDNAGGVGNDTENIIYEPGSTPPSGTYQVSVDNYADQCDGTGPSPFSYTVTLRYHGQTHTYAGQFYQGTAGTSHLVASFQY